MTYTAVVSNSCQTICLDQEYFLQMPSEFTGIEADNLQSKLANVLQSERNIKQIIIDFSQTNFINSSGLLALCQIVQSARNLQINLVFSAISPQVKMVFSLAGLDQVFACC